MSGTIPDEIANSYNLETFNISKNQFSGTISDSISSLTAIESLDLSYNLFFGSLEYKLFPLSRLIVLFVQGNQFAGNLENVFDMNMIVNLLNVDISDNKFSGNCIDLPPK